MRINLNDLPSQPGIYRFLDKNGRLLYIGKAKNLKNRVKSYFAKSAELSPAKIEMVSRIVKVEYTIVSNETEALLLESNLIKKYQPPFNIDLRDDKSWLYLVITPGPFSRLMAIRPTDPAFKKQQKYFGPYTSAYSVRNILKLLRKIFPYFTEAGPMVELRGKNSPYHLGRYLKQSSLTPAEWQEQLEQIKKFLSGRTGEIQKNLQQKMKQASADNEYEKAAVYRDQLTALADLSHEQNVIFYDNSHEDYLNFYSQKNQTSVCILKVRQGKLLDQLNFLIKNSKDLDIREIIEQTAERYYRQTSDLPKLIYSPMSLNLEQAIKIPQRGQRAKLLKLAEANAKNYLEKNLASFEKVHEQPGLKQLQQLLKLDKLPNRIECYDISNIQGSLSVGSMVVLTNGKIDKSQYRRFKIKTVAGIDDPRSMAEIIKRRLNNSWALPDLMVIDGGPTQLNAAFKVLTEPKLAIISLAKKNEEIYLPGEAVPIRLPKFAPALRLLQTIRDEAHRFAITYHRSLRNKKTLTK